MEDVLDVYQRPYDPLRPVVCLDETNRQLIEKRSIPPKPGNPEREDYEYRRCGVVDLFVAFEPLACKRVVKLTVPFPVSWTVKMKKKQKETQDILSYHSQAAGCSDKARAKASGGRQPIEECGRTGL